MNYAPDSVYQPDTVDQNRAMGYARIVTRSQFLLSCSAGACACAAVAIRPESADAQTSQDPEVARLTSRLDAARLRFAKLVGVMGRQLDAATRKKLFEGLGRECAQQYREMLARYRNNINGFLTEGRTQWMAEGNWDEKAGTLRIVDKAKTCTCPLVKEGLTPGDFCDCTLGWQKEAYSQILGKPVEAEIEESILRGGTRCVFRIHIA